MKFTLTITMGNDAMLKREDVARALETVVVSIRDGYRHRNIRDDNGATVGKFEFTEGTS